MDARSRWFPAWWRVTMAASGLVLLGLGAYWLSLPYHHFRELSIFGTGLFCLASAWKPPFATWPH